MDTESGLNTASETTIGQFEDRGNSMEAIYNSSDREYDLAMRRVREVRSRRGARQSHASAQVKMAYRAGNIFTSYFVNCGFISTKPEGDSGKTNQDCFCVCF